MRLLIVLATQTQNLKKNLKRMLKLLMSCHRNRSMSLEMTQSLLRKIRKPVKKEWSLSKKFMNWRKKLGSKKKRQIYLIRIKE